MLLHLRIRDERGGVLDPEKGPAAAALETLRLAAVAAAAGAVELNAAFDAALRAARAEERG